MIQSIGNTMVGWEDQCRLDGSTFEKLAENKIHGILIATPASSGKALYLRTDTQLFRFENR